MMTQQNNTTSWVLQDTNGQPQVVKFVQADGKAVSGIMTTSGQTIKILKSQHSDQDNTTQVITSGSQILKIGNSKLVTKALPVGTTFRYARTDSPYIQKTIRIAPSQLAQMQNHQLVTKLVSSTPQKIQTIQPQASSTPQSIIQQQNQKIYTSPPILDHSGSRKRQDLIDPEYAPEYKRRKTEKVGKGLRHFSMKVCEKVRKKGTTSYNEVADELVGEFTNSLNNSATDQQYDQKNIRRRVYDALNVLMAMNIISKEKKEIRWLGLPTNSVQECSQLEREKRKRIISIREKTNKLKDLILNQVAFKNLAARNKKSEVEHGPPASNSYIELPFVVIHTNKKTVVDCSISNDKMEYLFQFNDKFQVQDDLTVLKEIGMLMGLDKGECGPEDLEKIKALVPKALEDYIYQFASSSGDEIDQIMESSAAGPSNVSLLNVEDLVETQIDEDNSLQSSNYDPLSPNHQDFSDEEGESDLSSDLEIN